MNKKTLIIAGIAACMAAMPVYADDAIVIGGTRDDSVVSGKITRISGESLFVDSLGREIEIELDNLDAENLRGLFEPGMTITAKGNLKDKGARSVLKAEEIARTGEGAAADSILLNTN
jgi:hypothetical protein